MEEISIPQHIHMLKIGGGVCAGSISISGQVPIEMFCSLRRARWGVLRNTKIEVPRLACHRTSWDISAYPTEKLLPCNVKLIGIMLGISTSAS